MSELIEKKVLSDLLWAAARTNKERAGNCSDDIEQHLFYRGKWLAFTEVALYLDNAFDLPEMELQSELPFNPTIPCPHCLGLSSAAVDPRFGECRGGCRKPQVSVADGIGGVTRYILKECPDCRRQSWDRQLR